jgi:hypothetical protein
MLVKASIAIIIGIGFDDTFFPPPAYRRHGLPKELGDFLDSQFTRGP